jgi:peptidoglycan/LPS O-acetylase OafA/YrhL
VALTAVLLIFKPYLTCFFAGFLIADLLLHAQFRFPHGSLVGAVLICLAIVAACFYRPRSDAYWSIVSVMIVTGSAICAPVQRFFASGLSRALGTISFPLYLSHILVICSLSSFLYLELPSYGLGPVAALMANLGATTVASGLLAIALVPLETLSIFASRAISRMIMLLDHSLGEKGRLPTRAELLACVRSQLPR